MPQDVGEHLGLVVLLVMCREQQRERSVLALNVEESIKQLGVALELPPVALAELRPALDVVAVPAAELGRRRDLPKPQIDRCRRLAHAAWP